VLVWFLLINGVEKEKEKEKEKRVQLEYRWKKGREAHLNAEHMVFVFTP